MKKQKIKVKRSRSKKGDDKPINVSTMGDDTAPDSSSSPSEIPVGGNHLYYEEKKRNFEGDGSPQETNIICRLPTKI